MSGGMLALRLYQREAIDAVRAAWRRGMVRPAVVLPVGSGKTVVFSHLSVEWLAENPGKRVLILVHTQELLDQALGKLRSVAPGLRVGAVQADRNETLARVVVATVQTLRNERRRAMLRDIGLIICDEAHHAVSVTWRTILNHFGVLGLAPGEGARARCVGFTATMTRADDLALGDVWQDVVYTQTIPDMIASGHLVRPRGIHVRVDDLDLSTVKTTRGDYREGELGEAIENSMAPQAIAKAVAEHAPQRKIALFAPTVHSSEVIADALRASGRSAWLIHGGLVATARKAVLDAFRAASDGILCNAQLLTEGFDEPAIDCVTVARPTKSKGRWIQQVGRGLRPYPGKVDCLVLDVVGASKLGLDAGIDLFGEAPKLPQADSETSDDFEDLDEGQQDARQALGIDGPLVSTEVDLFAASSSRWLRTRAGVFFIPAGDRYIAILPSPPQTPDQWREHFAGRGGLWGYDVVTMHKNQLHTERAIVRAVPDLSYAMAWAEGDVTPAEKTTAAKDRSWQARPPTDKMRRLAAQLQIYVPPGARMGEVSNMITLALATKRIDLHLPAYLKGK